MEEANKNNVARMMQDNEISNKEQPAPRSEPLSAHKQEETKILADCQVSLPLTGLLKLVPYFADKVAQMITKNKTRQVLK